jgi:hypothetical protein
MRTAKRVEAIVYHPKAARASRERFRQLAGIVKFRGVVPSTKFLDAAARAAEAERDRD